MILVDRIGGRIKSSAQDNAWQKMELFDCTFPLVFDTPSSVLSRLFLMPHLIYGFAVFFDTTSYVRFLSSDSGVKVIVGSSRLDESATAQASVSAVLSAQHSRDCTQCVPVGLLDWMCVHCLTVAPLTVR